VVALWPPGGLQGPPQRQLTGQRGEIKMLCVCKLTLRGGYYNHALGRVAYLFNKEILSIQGHAVMFVKILANPFIGKRIMNI